MDTDISHAVEERFSDIENRLAILERQSAGESEPKEEEATTEEDPIAAFSATTTRGRRGSKEGTE